MNRRALSGSCALLLSLAAASPALASQDLAGDYIHLYYSDDGLWFDDVSGAGVTAYLGGSWIDFVKAGSTDVFIVDAFSYDKGSTTYEYSGSFDASYVVDWTTTSESDLSTPGTELRAEYEYTVGDLSVVRTEWWDIGSYTVFVRLNITNTSSSTLKNVTFMGGFDPDDAAGATSSTRNDVQDVDGDGTKDWAQSRGRTSNLTVGFGTCDPRNQEVGFDDYPLYVSDLPSALDDPNDARSDYTLLFRATETTLAAGDNVLIGYMLVFGESAADARTSFSNAVEQCYDLDEDGFENDLGADDDCDDTDATVNPDAAEVWYDGSDQDCGRDDDYDADGDGYVPDAYVGLKTTDPGTGSVISGTGKAPGGDCDDTDANVNPGEDEIWYDGIDQDCAEDSDYDADGDGYVPDDYTGLPTYDPGSGAVVDDGSSPTGDCDDTDAEVNPGADEVWYDGIDQDCAEDSDFDADGDGYTAEGYEGEPTYDPGTGEVVDDGSGLGGDCDDGDGDVHPDAEETWYDGIDADCGMNDDYDADGDGYVPDEYEGLPTYEPDGDLVEGTGDAPSGDCDDEDENSNPAADEIWYDGIDEDCAGDDDYDQDKDGYVPDEYEGEPTYTGGGAVVEGTGDAPAGDCDDTDPEVNPGAEETWYDGVDADCAGDDDYDADKDGYPSDGYDTNEDGVIDGSDGGDCDDGDGDINPGAEEDWYNGIDEDCGEDNDYDQDKDGYVPDEYEGLPTYDPDGGPIEGTSDAPAGDCDDTDPEVNPGAEETWYDGVDGDCAGDDDFDKDKDGYPADGYDTNGDGVIDDLDGGDCDDDDVGIFTDCELPMYKGGGGCGCATGPAGLDSRAGWLGMLALLGAVWRRRRAP